MANLAGYVQLHKRIRKHAVWTRDQANYASAFTDLLLLAVDIRCAPQVLQFHGQEIVLQAGQVCWSIERLAEEWKRSREWVRAFLKWCEAKGMLAVDANKRCTIITICNYETYQVDLTSESPSNPPSESTPESPHKGKGVRGNRVIGNDVSDNPPLPEIPDDRTMAEWFAAFTDLPRGIQGIPEGWWRGWVANKLERKQWPANWQAAAKHSYLADFINRHHKATGIAENKKNGATQTRPASGGRTPAQARFELSRELEQVRERLDACHETNVQPDPRDEAREKELETQLRLLTQEETK